MNFFKFNISPEQKKILDFKYKKINNNVNIFLPLGTFGKKAIYRKN